MPPTVLVPVYDDWAAVTLMLQALDGELAAAGATASVLIVDDGSTVPHNEPFTEREWHAVRSVDILHLRTNIGHQRAIAIGLSFLHDQRAVEAVVVMDGDGEDRPQDVPRLLAALERDGGGRVVFAERTRRSEGIVFSLLYWLYRALHRALTGERVRVGNFCVIPGYLLRRLVAVSHLWNHFAAAIFYARIPFTTIPTTRGRRLVGHSKMNFVALTTHGLSAMSVFGERIGVRLLIVTSLVAMVALATWVAFVTWHLTSGTPLPGWLGLAGVVLILLLFPALGACLGFAFIILAGRGVPGVLPFRQYRYYVSHVTSVPTVPYVQLPLSRN